MLIWVCFQTVVGYGICLKVLPVILLKFSGIIQSDTFREISVIQADFNF